MKCLLTRKCRRLVRFEALLFFFLHGKLQLIVGNREGGGEKELLCCEQETSWFHLCCRNLYTEVHKLYLTSAEGMRKQKERLLVHAHNWAKYKHTNNRHHPV